MVLSACSSATGPIRAGDGIESLARAFLYAGSRAVVASLWDVEDEAAVRTMEPFYRGVLRDGRAASEALREAKLQLRTRFGAGGAPRGVGTVAPEAGPRPAADAAELLPFDHPYYWAPFIYIGP